MARAKYFISFIAPYKDAAAYDRWTVFAGEGTQADYYRQQVPYDVAIGTVSKYIDTIRISGVRNVRVWIRTPDAAAALRVSPVVWAKSPAPAAGPGYGAVCIGRVKIDELLVTIDSHARMMS